MFSLPIQREITALEERERERERASAREGRAEQHLAIKEQKFRFVFSCSSFAIQEQARRKMSKKRQMEDSENVSVEKRSEVRKLSKDKKQKLERRMTEKGNDASKSGKQTESKTLEMVKLDDGTNFWRKPGGSGDGQKTVKPISVATKRKVSPKDQQEPSGVKERRKIRINVPETLPETWTGSDDESTKSDDTDELEEEEEEEMDTEDHEKNNCNDELQAGDDDNEDDQDDNSEDGAENDEVEDDTESNGGNDDDANESSGNRRGEDQDDVVVTGVSIPKKAKKSVGSGLADMSSTSGLTSSTTKAKPSKALHAGAGKSSSAVDIEIQPPTVAVKPAIPLFDKLQCHGKSLILCSVQGK